MRKRLEFNIASRAGQLPLYKRKRDSLGISGHTSTCSTSRWLVLKWHSQSQSPQWAHFPPCTTGLVFFLPASSLQILLKLLLRVP